MLYILAAIFFLIVILLCLRLRIRFVVGTEKRILFAGLGRTGIEIDFAQKSGKLKLAGIGIKSISVSEKSSKKKKAKKPPMEAEKTKQPKRKRQRDWKDAVRLLPGVSKTVFRYFVSLLRSLIVEELRADLRGGFDSPDLTGTAFGYYQAALAAAPRVVGGIRYEPDWTGASFSATARGSIALPMYKLAFHTMKALWRIPLREITKLAIGTKRGGQDG